MKHGYIIHKYNQFSSMLKYTQYNFNINMIDIKKIIENPKAFEKSAANKGYGVDLKNLIDTDKKRQEIDIKVQDLRQSRNEAAREKNIELGKKVKIQLDELEGELNKLEEEVRTELMKVPNLHKEDVKIGRNDSENDVIRKYSEPKKFNFTPLDHVALGEKLDVIDLDRAAKVSGSRFGYIKNQLVLLEFALVQHALNTLIPEGFKPVIPPVLIKKDVMAGMGYMEHGGDEDMFQITSDNMVLVGTAEHSIVPMHKDETLNVEELPLRYVGFSTAFRREAGSYGKDTKGILRVHQFDKVEMVSFVEEGKDDSEHEYILGLEEKLFQSLEIPYQVVKMCTGDLGFPTARKFDIEAWMPGQNKYREVTSASTITDFQSRRLNIKYKTENGKKYVNILNGTAFAIGRTIIAIMENYQEPDGSIIIPDVLTKYTGFEKISASF